MQTRPSSRTAAWVAVCAVVSGAWVALRIVASRQGVPAWLFWSFLAVETFALLRLLLWAWRLTTASRTAADPVDAEPAARPASAGALSTEVAVLLETEVDVDRLRMALMSAARTKGVGAVVVVGPESAPVDAVAATYDARRIVAEGAGTELALAALRDSSADLVAFVASDSIAHHDLFDLAAPDFDDPAVAWVQSMARSAPDRDSATSTANDVTGPADGANGVAPWLVDASVVRRAAFAAVVDADRTASCVAVATELAAAGWSGRWSNVSLAVTNGPEAQRHVAEIDAAAARLRTAASTSGPWRRGLPGRARLAAVSRVLDDLVGVAGLAALVLLAASLLSGRAPLSLDAWGVLVAGVVLHGAAATSRWRLSGRRLGAFATARTAFASVDASVAAALRAVTGRPFGARSDRLRLASLAALVLLVSLGLRALSSLTGWPLATTDRPEEMVVLTAALVATLPLLRAIDVIVPTRRRRMSGRVGSDVHAELDGADAEVVDLGPLSVGLRVSSPREVGSIVRTRLDLPGRETPLVVPGVVRSSVEFEDETFRLGVEFTETNPRTRDQLMEFWAASWIPAAASPMSASAEAPSTADLRVRVNRRSSPALRLLAAVTLVATGVASLPPYGVAGADEVPLPADTFVVTKDLRGIAPDGTAVQGSVLLGAEVAATVTAHNTWSTGNPARQSYEEVELRDVVPVGTRVVPGSFSIEPSDVLADTPEAGALTLVWSDVAEVLPGSTASVGYRLAPSDPRTGPVPGSIGATIGSEASGTASVVGGSSTDTSTADGADHTQISSTASGSVTVVPLQLATERTGVTRTVVRGEHRVETASVQVANNQSSRSTDVAVDEYLPAEVEFLGCGTTDRGVAAAPADGSAPAAAPTPPLDLRGGCLTPTTVETVELDPDAEGPLAPGVYTRVRWDIGDLDPGARTTIRYQWSVPERANVLWDPAATPDPSCAPRIDGCAQIADPANNLGASTTSQGTNTVLRTLTTLTGTTEGPLADGIAPTRVWGSDLGTIVADDLAVDLHACNQVAAGPDGGTCPNGVAIDGATEWNVGLRTGEYREVADAVVEVTIPDGLDLVQDSTALVRGDSPLAIEPSIGDRATDGSVVVSWRLDTLDPGTDARLHFRTTTAATTADGRPVLALDPLTVRTQVTGTSRVVVGSDATGEVDVRRQDSATLQSTWTDGSARTLRGAAAEAVVVDGATCAPGWSDTVGPGVLRAPGFAPGDLICTELLVDLPEGAPLADAVVSEELAAGVELVDVVALDDHDDSIAPAAPRRSGGRLVWDLGVVAEPDPAAADADRDVAAEARLTPREGGRFHVVVATRVDTATADRNVMRSVTVDGAGTSRQGPRGSSAFVVGGPSLGLRTEVVGVVRGDALIAAPEPTNDAVPVAPGDTVVTRTEIVNAGVQFRGDGVESARAATRVPADGGRAVQPSDALEVEVQRVLPDGADCDPEDAAALPTVAGLVSLPGALALADPPVATIVDSGCDPATGQVRVVVDRIPAGYALQLDASEVVPTGLPAGTQRSSTTGVRSYRDATTSTERRPADNVDPTIADDRDASPNAPAAADVTTLALPAPTLTSSASTSLDESGNGPGDAAVGETVTVLTDWTLPAGTAVHDLRLTVTEVPGLSVVPGSAVLRISDDVGGAPRPLVEDDGGELVIDLPGELRNDTDQTRVLTVVHDAVVTDSSTNVAGTVLEPGVSATWNDGASATIDETSDHRSATSSPVTVVAPSLSLTASQQPAEPVGGGTAVEFALDLSNAAGASVLHDLRVVDCVPRELGDVTPLGEMAAVATVTSAVGTGSAPCAEGTTRVDWDLSALAIGSGDVTDTGGTVGLLPGAAATLRYRATLAAPAAAGAELVSQIEAVGSSVPAEVTGGRAHTADATDTVRVAEPSVRAEVEPSSLAPGEVGTVAVHVAVPAGVALADTTLLDVVPADLERVGDPEFTSAGSCTAAGAAGRAIEPDGARSGWFVGDVAAGEEPCEFVVRTQVRAGGDAVAGDVPTVGSELHWNLTDRETSVDAADGTGFDLRRDAEVAVRVVEPSLRLTTTNDAPDGQVEAGQELRTTVTITNDGTHPAYRIRVGDRYDAGLGVPRELAGSCAGAELGSVDAEGRTATWQLHTGGPGDPGLLPGASCTLTYVQSVDAATAGTLEDGVGLDNVVDVVEFWATADPSDDEALDAGFRRYEGEPTRATVTPRLARLTIDKATAGGDEIADADVDSPLGWVLVVRNEGRGTAFGVDVHDTLPEHWRFDEGSVGITTSDGSTCAPSAESSTPLVSDAGAATGPRLEWNDVCDLGPRSSLTLTFTATPGAEAVTSPGLLDDQGDKALHPNRASVAGSDAGGTPLVGDEDDAAATLRSADLSIRLGDGSADDDGDPGSAGFVIGRAGAYQLDVTNHGPDAATGPVVVDQQLPAGLRALAAGGDGWSCEIAPDRDALRCTSAAPLGPDTTLPRVVVRVEVGEDVATDAPVVSSATVGSATPDPTAEKATDEEPTPVRRVADLTLATTPDPATSQVPGATVRHRVVVTNLGPSAAVGAVELLDEVPTGLRLRAVSGDGWDCAASVVPTDAVTGPASFSGAAPNDRNGRVACVRDAGGLAAGGSLPALELVTQIDPSSPSDAVPTPGVRVRHDSDPAASNDSGPGAASSAPTTSLAIVKDDGGAVFTAGQNDARYHLTVSNQGPAIEAGPVVVSDDIDEHLQLAAVEAPGWACALEPGTGFARSQRGSFSCTWVGPDPAADGDPAVEAVGVGEVLGQITVVVRVDPAAVRDPRPEARNTVRNRAAALGTTDATERSSTVETPVAPRASLRIDKSHDAASEPWTVGARQSFELLVANDGPSAEYGRVVATDVLPAGLDYVDATGDGWECALRTGAGTGPSGTVRCVAGRDGLAADRALLAAGETLPPITLQVEVRPEAAPIPQSDPTIITNWVSNEVRVVGVTDSTAAIDIDQVPVRPLADLTVAVEVPDGLFQVGSTGTASITVTNDGPNVAAAPTVVRTALPAGLALAAATGSDWTCPVGSPDGAGAEPELVCTYAATLGVDESATVGLTLAVAPEAHTDGSGDGAERSVALVAEVSGPVSDPDDSDDEVRVDVPVSPLVDLAVETTHAGDFSVGATGTFRTIVTNEGPNAAPRGSIRVASRLPDGLSFSGAAGDGWTCDVDGDATVVDCTTESALAVGAALAPLEVRVDVTPAAEGGVEATTEVSSDFARSAVAPQAADRSISVDPVAIVPLADLSVTAAVQGQLTTGRDALWRIDVRNAGPSAADDPLLLVRLPEGIEDVTASGDGFVCTVTGSELSCRRTSPLPADASSEVVVAAAVVASGGTPLSLTAKVSSTTRDADDGDAEAVVTETVAEVLGATQETGRSLPASLALTGLTVLGILAAAASLLLGGFMLTGFTRRRRSVS